MYLPGNPDRDAWIKELVATVESPFWNWSDIGLSLFDGRRCVARTGAVIPPFAGRVPNQITDLNFGDDKEQIDTYFKWATDPDLPPVRTIRRVMSLPVGDGPFTSNRLTVDSTTLRATTGPDCDPAFITYTLLPKTTRESTELEDGADRVVLSDEWDRICGIHGRRNRSLGSAVGLIRWIFVHPEDVVANLSDHYEVCNGTLPEAHAVTRMSGRASGWSSVDTTTTRLGSADKVVVATVIHAPPKSRMQQFVDPGAVLGAREMHVFEQVLAGASAVSIAVRGGVAASTVRNQLSRILEKLGTTTRGELVARYATRPPSSVARAVSAVRTFDEALVHAKADRPRYLRFDGTREQWVDAIGETIGSLLSTYGPIAIGLVDGTTIAASNTAFDTAYPPGSKVRTLFDEDKLVERSDRIRASEGALGTWHFVQRYPDQVMTVVSIKRNEADPPLAVLYFQPASSRREIAQYGSWAFLMDLSWRILRVSSPVEFPELSRRLVGKIVWLLNHPSSFHTIIDAVDALVAGTETKVDVAHDILSPDGWLVATSTLRLISGDEPLILWQLKPSRAIAVSDPTRLRELDNRDLALGLAAINGATVADIASELGLAHGTVRNRLSKIYAQLGVSSQAELIERYH